MCNWLPPTTLVLWRQVSLFPYTKWIGFGKGLFSCQWVGNGPPRVFLLPVAQVPTQQVLWLVCHSTYELGKVAVAKCVSERAPEQRLGGYSTSVWCWVIPICHLAGTGFPDPRLRSSAVRTCEPPPFVHNTPLLPPLLPSRSVPLTLSGTSWALLFLSFFWARFRTAPLPALQPSFAGFSNAFSIQFLLFSGLAMGFLALLFPQA